MRSIVGLIGIIGGLMLGRAGASLLDTAVAARHPAGAGPLFMVVIPLALIIGATAAGLFLALAVFDSLRLRGPGAPSLPRKIALCATLITGIPTLYLGMVASADYLDRPFSDRQLIRHFEKHRATFERIAAMQRQDRGLTRVGETGTQPKRPETIGIAPARIDQYRRLLRRAGAPHGFRADATGEHIEFLYPIKGNLPPRPGTVKGIAWSRNAPGRIVPRLDALETKTDHYLQAYRYIGGGWYLFYEYTPG